MTSEVVPVESHLTAGRVSPACGINEARPWGMMHGFLAVRPTWLKTDKQGCSVECVMVGL